MVSFDARLLKPCAAVASVPNNSYELLPCPANATSQKRVKAKLCQSPVMRNSKSRLVLGLASVIALSLSTTLPVPAQPTEAPPKKDTDLAPGQAEVLDLQTPESDVFLGEGVTMMVTVENIGDRPLGRFRVALLESSQVWSDKVYFVRLEPHANHAVRINWTPKQARRYNLRAVIIPEGQPISAKNLKGRGTPISLEVQEQPQSKLQLVTVTADPLVQAGQVSRLKVTVKNNGEMDATRIKISLDADHSRSTSHRIDKLPAGASYEAELEWTPHRPGKTQLVVGVEASGTATRIFKRVEKKLEIDVR